MPIPGVLSKGQYQRERMLRVPRGRREGLEEQVQQRASNQPAHQTTQTKTLRALLNFSSFGFQHS